MFYLVENKLIDGRQHGFMLDKSCTTSLLEFLDMVTYEMDRGNFIDIIYTDFSKAQLNISNCHLNMLSAALDTTNYLRNRSPSSALNDKSPF